ncbi:MAG: hypothetical protein HYV09_12275 [Deltaproteobacteria bacterium]|nr:hypothetical protein [Deltaproteobacteria bacterium]
MAPARSLLFLAAIAAATACRSGDDSPATCAAPYVARGGSCVPRFDDCGPAQVPVFGGGCATAGVPVDGCAEGFTHDGNGGCTPVLPAAPCPRGKIAVPGDTTCRELAACGEGTFGSIPVEARSRSPTRVARRPGSTSSSR